MTRRSKVIVAGVFLILVHLAALSAGFLAPYPYDQQHRDFPLAQPSRQFPLGTDALGRDILSRLLYGARISLFTGLFAAAISLAIGVILGALAGFFGGWVDRALMRMAELTLTLPWLYLLLGARAAMPLHIGALEVFLLLIAIIGVMGWARPARVIRGVALSARHADYVLAAEGFGASPAYLIRRHILPATMSVALTQATVLIPQYILAEVGLSFLGVGVGEPVPTWGNMLTDALHQPLLQYPWLAIPGVAAIPILFAWLVLADALQSK